MSMIATAVKHLLAAGVTGDALIAAIAEMEDSQPKDRAAENRRAYDRERKRAARLSTGIPPESADEADAVPSLDKSPPDPQKLIPTPLVHTHETRTRPTAWPCPEGVNPQHWTDFLAARKRKNLVNTETARLGVLRDIEKHADDAWPPGRLVEHAAAKGWGSINKPDGYQNGRPTGSSMGGTRGPSLSGHGSVVDSAQRVIARHQARAGGQLY